jgi:hypothetical protein
LAAGEAAGWAAEADSLRVASGQFLLVMRPWAERLRQPLAAASVARLRPLLAGLGTQFLRFDPTAALIRGADRIEAFVRALGRLGGAVSGVLRLPAIRLTTGLVWRGLAAAAGIGAAGALVTALSSQSEATISSYSTLSEPAQRPLSEVVTPPRATAAGQESWVAIARPIPIFGLESPELERQPAVLDARRSADGTRREDLLSFGGFAEPKPHLALRLAVQHERDELSRPFIVALVRTAAARGLSVQRSSLPAAVETRFGPVEAADVTLSDGASGRACIAFRMEGGTVPLALSGWWCGGEGKPADRRQLVCLIDRIDLLNAGEDPALRGAFARSELNRQPGCAPPRLSASGRKVSWLDADAPAPALRTKTGTAQPGAARRAEKR